VKKEKEKEKAVKKEDKSPIKPVTASTKKPATRASVPPADEDQTDSRPTKRQKVDHDEQVT
jgi:hypothetical protein